MSGKAEFARTLIIGNSGSGKSWLAAQLAERLGTQATDLDDIHWEPGGYGAARDKSISLDMLRQVAERPAWIIEGVYGWLAREAALNTTTLIWLDIPVDECIGNLRRRGLRRGGSAADFDALLAWAADYPHRQTSSSRVGHEALYLQFSGEKHRLLSKEEINRFLVEFDGRRAR